MHHHELVDNVHRLLMDNLPLNNGKTPSGWTTFNCPMCSDKRKRGGVIQSNAKISYHCFNCGFKCSWQPGRPFSHKMRKLFHWLNTPDDIINWAIECEVTKKPYRIIKQELDFYRKFNYEVEFPNINFQKRLSKITTAFAFDRPTDLLNNNLYSDPLMALSTIASPVKK